MFQDRYRKDIEAVGPTEEQLARLTAALEEQEGKPMKTVKLTFKTVLIAAALCVAMAVTALAVSPGLREALGELLSGFEPYVQMVDGTTAVADGIEVKVVSAMSDPNTARIYYEVRDLKGNRVDDKSIIDVEAYIPEEGEEKWDTMSFSGGSSLHYDPESKAALMDTQVHWERNRTENATVHLDLSDLTTSIEWLCVPFPEDVKLTDRILDSETLKDGRVVLKPNQTFRELEHGRYALSSFGFGSDDRLHFLWQINDPDFNQEESLIRCGVWSKSEMLYQDSRGKEGAPCEKDYYDAPDPVLFQKDGVLYYDVCYNAGVEDMEDIWWGDIQGSYCTGVRIEGPWSIEVPLVNAPVREIDMNGHTLYNGAAAKNLSLSTLSATLTSARPGEGIASSIVFDMALYLRDGTVIPNQWGRGNFSKDPDNVSNYWLFDDPIVPEDVVGVAIGQWYIPIEGNAAQPGHWLPKLP